MLFTAALTPDGAGVITGTRETGEPTVAVWSTSPSANQALLTFDKEQKWIYSVAFSPDGSRIVTASDDRNARVWLREPGRWAVKDPPIVLPHQGRVLGAVFSPDGRKIATSSADRHVRIWDPDGKVLRDFSHSDEVWQIGFSSDGKWLVSSSLDGTAKVWDLDRNVSHSELAHPLSLRAAAFRPGTLEVVTGADDGAVRLWRTDPGELLQYMQHASTACLKPDDRKRLLGDSDKAAQSGYAACEARNGR
jgi:WD40 repeat protein